VKNTLCRHVATEGCDGFCKAVLSQNDAVKFQVDDLFKFQFIQFRKVYKWMLMGHVHSRKRFPNMGLMHSISK